MTTCLRYCNITIQHDGTIRLPRCIDVFKVDYYRSRDADAGNKPCTTLFIFIKRNINISLKAAIHCTYDCEVHWHRTDLPILSTGSHETQMYAELSPDYQCLYTYLKAIPILYFDKLRFWLLNWKTLLPEYECCMLGVVFRGWSHLLIECSKCG